MSSLTILCVTQCEPYACVFLGRMVGLAKELKAECVFGADGQDAFDRLEDIKDQVVEPFQIIEMQSKGFIESVLDDAVAACTTDYILRLDDDEQVSPALYRWLKERKYESTDHWSFPRMHMWPTAQAALVTPHLFPDLQTRLSVKAKSGGRHTLHAPSPFGSGEIAPACIEHHKFLVRSRSEREMTSLKWHSGAMLAFSLPEDAYKHQLVTVMKSVDGSVPLTGTTLQMVME